MDIARREGFRVRLAATVFSRDDADALDGFFASLGVASRDRLIRPVVRRGFASGGIALSRADLVPEITITAEGVYWHPVGAEDADLHVTPDIFPLAAAFEAARAAVEREREHATRLASIFYCA
jgi:hypothetical protein